MPNALIPFLFRAANTASAAPSCPCCLAREVVVPLRARPALGPDRARTRRLQQRTSDRPRDGWPPEPSAARRRRRGAPTGAPSPWLDHAQSRRTHQHRALVRPQNAQPCRVLQLARGAWPLATRVPSAARRWQRRRQAPEGNTWWCQRGWRGRCDWKHNMEEEELTFFCRNRGLHML
jgi:hypothetical protein